MKGKAGALALALAILLCLLAPQASATSYQRPFKEVFGPAEQQVFQWPNAMAVDPRTGDVLVFDQGESALQKVTFTGFAAGDQFTLGNLPADCSGSTSGAIEYKSPESALAAAVEAKLGESCSPFPKPRIFGVSGTPGGFIVRFDARYGEAPQPPITCAVVPGHGGGGCTVEIVEPGVASGVHRYHADGTPAPFAALGTNLLDGRGSGACPYPPTPSAECDGTPQNKLQYGGQALGVAVDGSSGATAGDIYVAQEVKTAPASFVVSIFSSEGRYLGQLTSGKAGTIKGIRGLAVDPRGALYVSGSFAPSGKEPVAAICKYVTVADHPVNGDSSICFPLSGAGAVAAGAGPSDGWLFVQAAATVWKVSEESGESHNFFSPLGENRSFMPLAVDPVSGNPVVAKTLNEVVELEGAAETAGAPLSRLEIDSEFGKLGAIAVGNSGDLYVAMNPPGENFRIRIYGEPVVVPTATAGAATEVLTRTATLNGSVNPEGTELSECFFEWGPTTSYGNTAPCEPGAAEISADSEDHEVKAPIAGLLPNKKTYHYRLAVKNTADGTGLEYSADEVLRTLSTALTEAAEVTGTETATLKATVRPEGHGYTACVFEYGLAANQAAYEHTAPCEPAAGTIPVDSNPHEVKAQLSGLAEATSYRFRIKATNSEGTQEGEEELFETFGPPKIAAIRASGATQGAVTLEAEINPAGFATSYRFEWGPTDSYGEVVTGSLDAGTTAERVTAPISGLSARTTYHYRLIVNSTAGEDETPDQTLETLNACNLPDGRCFEMVSPRAPFAPEQPGSTGFGVAELRYQAAEQPGSLAYFAEAGQEDATRGNEVLYRANREPGESGWSRVQLGVPAKVPDRQTGSGSPPGVYQGLSKDLSCGEIASTQPLTEDPVAELIREAGGGNLYRRNPDGTYTLITNRPPEELKRVGSGTGLEFELVGMSSGCSKVVFSTGHHYAGVAGAKAGGLYEWEEGSGLRYVGFVPKSGGGEEAVAATGGNGIAGSTSGNRLNAVSEDGSRVFFTATRKVGKLAGEVGTAGVFVREGGASTRDISASETAKAATGIEYQGATPDGQHVYFTAVAGIAKNGASPTGTDLYEYDYAKPEGERLTDLSVGQQSGGAQVGGAGAAAAKAAVVGFASDGSHVYFVARGQLVPGKGRTLAGNESAQTLSLYDYERATGSVSYVATVEGDSRSLQNLTVGIQISRTSRVSAGGRYLLFESKLEITGYRSGDVREAYLYDAEANGAAGRIVCLSCRPDGNPSVSRKFPNNSEYQPLSSGGRNPRYEPQSLVMRGGEPVAFFVSQDALAPGAIEGQVNLYEWAHGQVFLIASEPPGSTELGFAGASGEGTDLYFFASAPLNWENPEARPAAWDARVGGGFTAPAAPPSPCDPSAEGSCAAGSGSQAGTVPGPASATFSGPGNAKPKSHKQQKKKKHHKAKKKGQHKKKQKRAKGNRRAGK